MCELSTFREWKGVKGMDGNPFEIQCEGECECGPSVVQPMSDAHKVFNGELPPTDDRREDGGT